MERQVVVSVKNVCKSYNLYGRPIDRLKESLSFIRHKSYHSNFDAVKNISFEVKKGECFGIIGTNGSGKSTTLKMLTGVLNPTSGEINIEGKLSALLELGAGFNMDYTGIENIYMNGMILGYKKEEIAAMIPKIEEFAEIGDFINQPVKMYSSGMFARLAFAVAINVDPDILIVDEALSVGDIFFQAKCYKKFDELKAKGKTILFVTHDMSSVLKYCDRVMLLNRGELVKIGKPAEIVNLFKKILANSFVGKDLEERKTFKEFKPGELWRDSLAMNPTPTIYGDDKAKIVDFGIFDEKGEITNSLSKFSCGEIKIKVQFYETVMHPIIAVTIKNRKGLEIMGTNTMYLDQDIESVKEGEILTVSFSMNFPLSVDQYLVDLGVTKFNGENLEVMCRYYEITTVDILSGTQNVGIVDPNAKVTIEKE